MAKPNGQPPNGSNGSALPSKTNGNDIDPYYKLPEPETLKRAGELKIKDEEGNEIAFKSLYDGKPGRQLIIFIRHFYCGLCEEYVRALAASLPPATLAQTTPPTTLTIIGCGDPVCIPEYRARTMAALGSQPFALYCDPTRALHSQLDMTSTMKMAPTRPGYMTTGIVVNAASSMMTALRSGSKMLKGGPGSQNGGEYLFVDGSLTWCHRMKDTGSHTEVGELKDVLGME